MKKSAYIIPFIPIMYGVLTLKGIHIPRIQPEDGLGWLIFGILFLILIVVADYLVYKGIFNTGYEDEIKPRKPLDIFCIFLFNIGIVYLVIYFFKLYVNDGVFAVVLFIFALCGGRFVKS